jgi:hypothetical protein
MFIAVAVFSISMVAFMAIMPCITWYLLHRQRISPWEEWMQTVVIVLLFTTLYCFVFFICVVRWIEGREHLHTMQKIVDQLDTLQFRVKKLAQTSLPPGEERNKLELPVASLYNVLEKDVKVYMEWLHNTDVKINERHWDIGMNSIRSLEFALKFRKHALISSFAKIHSLPPSQARDAAVRDACFEYVYLEEDIQNFYENGWKGLCQGKEKCDVDIDLDGLFDASIGTLKGAIRYWEGMDYGSVDEMAILDA